GNIRPGFWQNRLGRIFQKISYSIIGLEQCFDFSTQFSITTTSALQIRSPFGTGQLKRLGENFHVAIGGIVHRIALSDYIAVPAPKRAIIQGEIWSSKG